jgi:hypothetical protein
MGGLFRLFCVAAVTATAACFWPDPPETARARWFMPGALGNEPGRTQEPTKPGFKTRAFSGLNSPAARSWGHQNALSAPLAFSHNLNTVFPPESRATHPEFFPLVDGTRLSPPKDSYFWNPDIARRDVAAHAASVAAEFFDRTPTALSFALGANDGLIWGESAELKALATPVRWFRERPDYSDVVFTFMNRVAEQVERTHPEKYLGTLAYYWTEQTPRFAVHPQVMPFLTADRSQGYDPGFWAEEMALQRAWGELAGAKGMTAATFERRLGLYDYLYGRGFLIPRIHTRLIAEHLRHAFEAGFTDYYAEVTPNWGLDGPMPWLVAQLGLDPSQSADALLAEYYARFYREAGGPMRRFFERCEALWMAQPGPSYWLKHYRNESQAIVFPASACAELRGLLTEAEALARTPRVRARVHYTSAAFGVTERFVRFKEARDAVLRASLTAEPDPGSVRALLERYRQARGEFVRYTHDLQRTQPLALHSFGWDDYLKSDPVPLAEAVLEATERGNSANNEAGERGRQLLVDAGMRGEAKPARRIADLTYGVALPAAWQSKVEPAEHHRAGLVQAGDSRVLRIEGTRDTMVSQWTPVGDGQAEHLVTLRLRGRVSPSNAVWVILAFLDAGHRHVGFKTVRLPDGEWPRSVELRQTGRAPANAAWVGMGLRVQNQLPGDWIEATAFSLRN